MFLFYIILKFQIELFVNILLMHNNKLKNNLYLNNLIKYHKHKSPYKIMFKIIPLKIKFINSIMESEILL